MATFEHRFRKAWTSRMKALALPRRQFFYALGDAWQAFVSGGFTRLLAWGVLLTPFPQSWHLCAVFATTAALCATARLKQRGRDESVLALYGADDRELLTPTAQWQRRRLVWAGIDALVVLGAWWMLARVPAWAVLLGVPAYATAAVISPRVLAAVLPTGLLSLFAGGSVMGATLLAILVGQFGRTAGWSEPIFWLLGLGSPSGWVVLMVHGVLDQKPLLWGLLPLLAAATWAARSFARVQDGQFVAQLTTASAPREDRFSASDWDEEFQGEARASESAVPTVAAALNGARSQDLLTLPVPNKAPSWRKAAWTSVILLGLAVLVRSGVAAQSTYPVLAFGVAVALAHGLWFPLLGLPAWFWEARISLQRAVSMCALYPAPLRTVLRLQMDRDLRQALRVSPGLALVVFLAFQIAFAPPLPVAPASAVLLILITLLLLPLRWLRLAHGVLSPKPFRLTRLAQVALAAVVVALLLIEAVYLTISAYLVFGAVDLSPERYWVATLVLVPALVNALLALTGAWLALRAYEGARYDVVKVPPRA